MAKRTLAFHCRHQLIYHTNYGCVHAMGILPTDRIAGKGDGVECLNCQQLNRAAGQRINWKQRLKQFLRGRFRKDS